MGSCSSKQAAPVAPNGLQPAKEAKENSATPGDNPPPPSTDNPRTPSDPNQKPPVHISDTHPDNDVAYATWASSITDGDPGDLWLNSELPSSPTPDDDGFDNGDDVDDFDKPPDGQLVFATSKECVAFMQDFASSSDGRLFEDPDFTATWDTVYPKGEGDVRNIVWRRPHELCSDPQMMVDGLSHRDVVQGELGDCWVLSACSAIAKYPRLMEKVVPLGQTFGDKYGGMFRFRFWRFGRWVNVIVDDRLPTRNGRLIFARSDDDNEFWPSLVEKAYAKLHGSYGGLAGGMAADALVDLTGGLAEVYSLTSWDPSYMFDILYRGTRNGAFMCCSRKGNWRANEANALGIVTGHAYTIQRVQTGMMEDGSRVRLVHIRNPWANSMEWRGEWSDSSEMWSRLTNRDDFEVGGLADGEFWMSYTDFLNEFTKVVLCTSGPDFDGDGVPDVVNDSARGFHLVTRHGRWIKDVNAGGCHNFISSTFATNPQIMISLLEPDEDNDDRDTQGKCSVVITLLQEYRRVRNKKRGKKQQIGFALYKVADTEKPMTREDLYYAPRAGSSGTFINHREVVARFNLDPGHYAIIPSTFKQNITCRFITRIFTEKPILCVPLQAG